MTNSCITCCFGNQKRTIWGNPGLKMVYNYTACEAWGYDSHSGLDEEAHQQGYLFRHLVYKRVGIVRVGVYKRVGKTIM